MKRRAQQNSEQWPPYRHDAAAETDFAERVSPTTCTPDPTHAATVHEARLLAPEARRCRYVQFPTVAPAGRTDACWRFPQRNAAIEVVSFLAPHAAERREIEYRRLRSAPNGVANMQ
jgi:hypothetical protein